MTSGILFPQLRARDLDGREVLLPAQLPGEWNVAIVAFRRQQQLVDSWVPWLQQQSATASGLEFVELPAIGLAWQSARPVIDGGMAAAISDEQARQRVLTVYTDVRRLTAALGITPATAHVTVTADRLVACFGPRTCRTKPANEQAVRLTGPYRPIGPRRAIGPRLSLADHGLTFGTTTRRGVFLLLRETVPGIESFDLIRHPRLTLTVAEPRRLAAAVRDYAGLPSSGNEDTAFA